jgi:DNA-binding NarL/FixJ family response regulator
MRQGLRSLLDQQDDMEVVAEASDGGETVALASRANPDVIVMDVSMPGLNGIEATRQIVARCPQVRVLALSMYADKRFAAGMLAAGAAGYLLKDARSDELLEAVRQVHAGRRYLGPEVTGIVVDDYVSRIAASAEPSAFDVLTSREREVLQLVAEGHSTKDIASRLHVSPKTVETHRRQIMERLDLHSVADLTRYAIREGLVSLEG